MIDAYMLLLDECSPLFEASRYNQKPTKNVSAKLDSPLDEYMQLNVYKMHSLSACRNLPLFGTPSFFIIAVQTPGSGISILLAVGTPSTGSGNLYCQWELSPDSGNALCILFLAITDFSVIVINYGCRNVSLNIILKFQESVAIGGETFIIQMSTTTSDTNFLNGFYGSWRWGCLKLFENSGHGGSHINSLLVDCMNCHWQQNSKNLGRPGLRHCRKYQVGAIRFFIIAVQTPGSGISILLAVGTPSTDSGNLYCHQCNRSSRLRTIFTTCGHNAHVEDIVVSETAIARIFLYPGLCNLPGSGFTFLLAVASFFTGSEKKLKDGGEGTWFHLSHRFITTCSYPNIKYKDIIFQDFRYSDTVIHTVKTNIVKLVVEIESFGMSSDKFNKEIRSSDRLQPKKADLNCVQALNELHLHEIHVVPSKHEADQY
nr:hypothetical protein [Tanacetum cinerariifolium]